MLILARNPGESIIIDGDIQVKVLEVSKNGSVRLGISAPKHHHIYREELFLAIQAENRTAAELVGDVGGLLELLPKK
jgi:carbon storage regulator